MSGVSLSYCPAHPKCRSQPHERPISMSAWPFVTAMSITSCSESRGPLTQRDTTPLIEWAKGDGKKRGKAQYLSISHRRQFFQQMVSDFAFFLLLCLYASPPFTSRNSVRSPVFSHVITQPAHLHQHCDLQCVRNSPIARRQYAGWACRDTRELRLFLGNLSWSRLLGGWWLVGW